METALISKVFLAKKEINYPMFATVARKGTHANPLKDIIISKQLTSFQERN